jgi:hypothetical protein
VCQTENVQLLERSARLGCQVQESGPVLGKLTLIQGVVKLQGLLNLPLFPTRIKSEKENLGRCDKLF